MKLGASSDNGRKYTIGDNKWRSKPIKSITTEEVSNGSKYTIGDNKWRSKPVQTIARNESSKIGRNYIVADRRNWYQKGSTAQYTREYFKDLTAQNMRDYENRKAAEQRLDRTKNKYQMPKRTAYTGVNSSLGMNRTQLSNLATQLRNYSLDARRANKSDYTSMIPQKLLDKFDSLPITDRAYVEKLWYKGWPWT